MISQLHITAAYKGYRTYLKDSFCSQPFKLGNITEDKSKNLLKLMIMSSSPGILDNDNYKIKIEIEEDAQLQLTTQGYQRIFSMLSGAEQTMSVYLRNSSSFTWLPHPNVAHEKAKYTAINNIFLSSNHNLLWGEIITCGRKLCDEQFRFCYFKNATNIYINKRLAVKENILMEPSKRTISSIGQLEGYTHQSTLLYINDTANVDLLMHECYQLLSAVQEIEVGISLLAVNGFCIRMMGNKGEQLFETQKLLSCIIAKETAALIV